MESTNSSSSYFSTPTYFTESSWASTAGSLQWQGRVYNDSPPQQETRSPRSPLRIDVKEDRFALPKACVAVDGLGMVKLGLNTKPSLRINGPAFEQAKALENYEHAIAQQAGQQTGPRFAASNDFQLQLQQQRVREEEEEHKKRVDSIIGAISMLPNYATSHDNVLSDTLTISPAKQASCPSSSRSSRPASRPHSPEIAAKAQRALRGHLTIGSLMPEDSSDSEDEGGEQQQQQEGGEGNGQLAVMARAEAAYAQAHAKMDEVMANYPHGAPNRTRRDLAQQGITLPALGFTSRGTFEIPR